MRWLLDRLGSLFDVDLTWLDDPPPMEGDEDE